MAKKSPAKQTKKVIKTAPAAPRAQRAASVTSSRKPAAQSKYQQSGAPWWKQFLPG
jgi:hypothetical protein